MRAPLTLSGAVARDASTTAGAGIRRLRAALAVVAAAATLTGGASVVCTHVNDSRASRAVCVKVCVQDASASERLKLKCYLIYYFVINGCALFAFCLAENLNPKH
jgi:hypothetical protein